MYFWCVCDVLPLINIANQSVLSFYQRPSISLILLLLLSVFNLLNSAEILLTFLSSIAISMLTLLLILLTVFLHSSCGLAAIVFRLMLTYSGHKTCTRVNRHLHFIILYTGKLWNILPLPVFLPSCDLDAFKRGIKASLQRPPL